MLKHNKHLIHFISHFFVVFSSLWIICSVLFVYTKDFHLKYYRIFFGTLRKRNFKLIFSRVFKRLCSVVETKMTDSTCTFNINSYISKYRKSFLFLFKISNTNNIMHIENNSIKSPPSQTFIEIVATSSKFDWSWCTM